MAGVAETLAGWAHEQRPFALATVIAVHRSAPRAPGSKMGIAADGELVGSVSGGCVEGAVSEAAAELGPAGPARVLHYGIADSQGWEVGLPCGGEIDVLLEPVGDAALRRFLELQAAGVRSALVTVVDAEAGVTGRLLIGVDGELESRIEDLELHTHLLEVGSQALWHERSQLVDVGELRAFVDVTAPPPTLMIFGAGEFAQALARLALTLEWRVVVCDPRSRFADPARFPGAEVIARWPSEAVEEAGGIDRATYVAVLSHDPKIDEAALALALRSDAAYVGAMGSRRATAARRERLRAQGLTDAELDRLAAPIGLDLGGAEPSETAIAIVAEMVAVRNGRDGGRLSRSQRPISAPAG
jgi:xanthine dehydrogenase accessory factor